MKWIPVSKKPKKNGHYQIYTDNGRFGYGDFMSGTWRDLFFKNADYSVPNVAYWMPLPPRPEGIKEQQ